MGNFETPRRETAEEEGQKQLVRAKNRGEEVENEYGSRKRRSGRAARVGIERKWTGWIALLVPQLEKKKQEPGKRKSFK